MKSILFKSVFVLLLSFAFIQNSSAYGHYEYRGGRYCGPRYYGHYYGPRYAPAPYYYHPVYVPGYWTINPYGVRIWVGPCYR